MKKTTPDRLRRWTWADPVYRENIFLLRGPGDQALRWINRTITQDDDYKGTFRSGKMVHYAGDRGTALVIWMPTSWDATDSQCLATLAHECFHGAVAVLGQRGVKFTEGSEEAFSYYLGWLFKTCHERLSR